MYRDDEKYQSRARQFELVCARLSCRYYASSFILLNSLLPMQTYEFLLISMQAV